MEIGDGKVVNELGDYLGVQDLETDIQALLLFMHRPTH